MELLKGLPENAGERPEKEMDSYRFLEKLGIDYVRADHEAAFTIEACREVDLAFGVAMCKNLFLCNRQQTDFYLLLMPGGKKFKTKDLSKQLGVSRLSFAGEELMESLLNLTPGSVTVLGLMYDPEKKVRLLIDRDLLDEEYFGMHPCINTASVRIATKDLLERLLPALGREAEIVELPVEEEE